MFKFRNILFKVRQISGLYIFNSVCIHFRSYYNMCKLKRFFYHYVSYSIVYLFDIFFENRLCNKKKISQVCPEKNNKKHFSMCNILARYTYICIENEFA